MSIINPFNTLPKNTGTFLLLYGEPGVGKTSLALTSKNPVLLDFDRGFRRACIFKDTFVIEKGWQEIIDLETEIMKYDDIIIDTAKACLDDVIAQFVIKSDFKNKKNAGGLSLAGYGAMGETFKTWESNYRLANKNIIVVAHSKDQNDNDNIIKIPDVTGGTYSLLLRLADQVGYVHTKNNERVISFTPSDKNIGKDTAGLGTIKIPNESTREYKDFTAEIIDKVQSKMNDRINSNREHQEVITEYEKRLSKFKNAKDFDSALQEVEKMPKSVQTLAKQILLRESKAKKFEFDSKEKKFKAAA